MEAEVSFTAERGNSSEACFGMPRFFRAGTVLAMLFVCGQGMAGTTDFNGPVYSSTGPHVHAVRLIAEKRAEELRSLDGGEDARSFDTRVRTWTTQRPFAPGIIDSRFLIEVTYAVDGKIVGEWTVNTCSGEIAGRGDAPIAIEGCGEPVRRSDPAAPAGRP